MSSDSGFIKSLIKHETWKCLLAGSCSFMIFISYSSMATFLSSCDIYKVGSFLDCRVKFEPSYFKCEIPQCINCQRYGHTKNVCSRKTRGIKSAGGHSTINCSRRKKSKNIKCMLCEGNHPANYKGCMASKDLQRNFFPILGRKVVTSKSQPRIKSASIHTRHIQPGRSYASQFLWLQAIK